MASIHIREIRLDNSHVRLEVDGVLHLESVSILRQVCENYLVNGKKLALDLAGLTHVTREGRNYLGEIRQEVTLVNLPSFVAFGREPVGKGPSSP